MYLVVILSIFNQHLNMPTVPHHPQNRHIWR